ncbi:MAG: cellulase family glycosylhydrolase [Flavobacteriales bacterium]|nr:cellulase family glycosylhydrolase [Flavobacteriales bacterium]MEB2340399.1 cellulase family glycosylhydrolase [Flavobacteriia bacterium]
MKPMSLAVLASILLLTGAATAQNIHVDGRWIIGPCGDTLILKGVNYAPYNWGWSPDELHIDQIALSGANCVRLPWYEATPDGAQPQATYDNLAKLDQALAACTSHGMIPILDLHDQKCANDPAALIALANWYTQPGVMAVLDNHAQDMIINVANEALNVLWSGNPAAAQATFVSTYTTIINNLRNAGIGMPLMIDAPDCGINLDVLAEVGSQLLQADPQGNLIFSAHGYWHSFANNDPAQMQVKMDHALDQGIPFVMAEVANLQDDAQMCQYTLDYNALLNICTEAQVGWLAWSWDRDGCSARQISTNGMANSLTPYGNDIVNNPGHGLAVNTVRSAHLVLEDCSSTGMGGSMPTSGNWTVWVDMPRQQIDVEGLIAVDHARLVDLQGRAVPLARAGRLSFHYGTLAPGIYTLVLITREGRLATRNVFLGR